MTQDRLRFLSLDNIYNIHISTILHALSTEQKLNLATCDALDPLFLGKSA